MDSEILYKSINTGEITPTYLDYYIIPESISASYCDLKCYGIKIEKTTMYEGGGRVIESSQINNVFYRYEDVPAFLNAAAEKQIQPDCLREFMEKYIVESIDRAKQKA